MTSVPPMAPCGQCALYEQETAELKAQVEELEVQVERLQEAIPEEDPEHGQYAETGSFASRVWRALFDAGHVRLNASLEDLVAAVDGMARGAVPSEHP